MEPEDQSERRYRRLFDRYHREVYAYCRRRADAETAADCASDAFLVAWRRLDDIPAGDGALGWLYGVARRTLANEFRRERRRRRLLDRLLRIDPLSDPPPEILVVRRERDDTVLAAIERLRPQEQELLRLALWEELPHAEIAAQLGCTPQAVTQRIYRATRRAAKEYQRLDHAQAVTRAPRQQLRGGETR